MNTFKFKTNINCGSCVATVTPFLDGLDSVSQWEVDTNNKDKVLTVVSKDTEAEQIIKAVQTAGYKIEKI